MLKARKSVLLLVLVAQSLAACAVQTPRRPADTAPSPAPPAPAPPPVAPPPSGTSAAVAQELLTAHNYWRKQVKSQPLVWSDELSKRAREWALTLLRKGVLEHNPDAKYGENLAWFAGERLKATDVVDNWGNEVEYYDHGRNVCIEGVDCEHYTQIIWKDTREVGCASAYGEHPKYGIQEYWVCNYSPAGNIKGQRPY